MKLFEETVSVENIFNGKIIQVHLDKARLEDGRIVNREVAEHCAGVGVLPIDENGICYFVRQFRYPLGRTVLEIPAGKVDGSEAPEKCGLRELSEETGFTAESLIACGSFYVSPGFTTEKIYIYIADKIKKGSAHLDDGEFLNVEAISFDEAVKMMKDGLIEDAKTAIAIQAAMLLKAQN